MALQATCASNRELNADPTVWPEQCLRACLVHEDPAPEDEDEPALVVFLIQYLYIEFDFVPSASHKFPWENFAE